MHVALIILMLLSRKVALSEAPSEETTTILNTTTHIIGILNTLSIGPPVLNPFEDPWLPIDNRIEFIFEHFPTPAPSVWNLDAVCQAKDEGAEAIRIPSYPNIISSLIEIRQSDGIEHPWISNVMSLEDGEEARSDQCHQLVLPVPSNQVGFTRVG